MRNAKIRLGAALLAACACCGALSGAEVTVGVAGTMTLAQGGSSRLRSCGGGLVRGGVSLTETSAVEAEIGCVEDIALAAVQGRVHFSAWSVYDEFFGFSAFDPFLTGGARGWLGRAAGQVGPKAGVGAYYHLTDAFALRFDADVTLGLDTEVEADYSLSVGVEWSF